MNGPPRAWMRHAACRDLPLTLFFGPDGEDAVARAEREKQAKAVCAGCPVRVECLMYRLGYPYQRDDGIWAGFDGGQRAQLRRSDLRRQRHAERTAAA